jgi:hypothetical protein
VHGDQLGAVLLDRVDFDRGAVRGRVRRDLHRLLPRVQRLSPVRITGLHGVC